MDTDCVGHTGLLGMGWAEEMRACLVTGLLVLSLATISDVAAIDTTDLVMPDRIFFEALDLSCRGLEKVKKAVETNDLETAKAGLVEHFRLCCKPGLIETNREPADIPTATNTPGELAFDGYFKSLDGHIAHIGKAVDWLHYPKAVDNRYQYEMVMTFNWHESLADLAKAYLDTGNHKYATECFRLLLDWIGKMAPFPEKPPSRGISGIPWKQVNYVAPRIDNWLKCYFYTRDCPAIPVDDRIAVLKGILAQIRYVASNDVNCANMIMGIVRNRMGWGTQFPEFKESKAWREGAVERVVRLQDEVLYPDGGYIELCYFAAVRGFMSMKETAESLGLKFPPDYTKKIERFYEFMMYFTSPNGWGPLMNDFYSVGDPACVPPTLGGWVAGGAELFGREDMKYANTRGKEGKPPEHTSRAFPYSGVYVMRSDWSGEARYLVFDGGTSMGTHNHIDKLDFELHAFGHRLITGTGCGGPWGSKWRDDYYVGTAGHNTIIVDGRGQVRHLPDFPEDKIVTAADLSPEPLDNVWITSRNFDFVSSKYEDGYGRRNSTEFPWLRSAEGKSNDPREKLRIEMESEEATIVPDDRVMVTHERKIFFLKPDYWIMNDLVTGEDTHKIESLFHMLPEATVLGDTTGRTVTVELHGAGLLIIPVDSDQTELSIVRGQLNPIQGWVPDKWGEHRPAPTAIYGTEKRLPIVLDTVLYPYQEGKKPEVKVERLWTRKSNFGPADACALKIGMGNDIDYYAILHNKSAGAKRFGSLEFDGEMVALRTSADKKVKRISMVGGTYLKWAGRRLFKAKEPLEKIDIEYSGELLWINCQPETEIKVMTQGADKAIHNAEEHKISPKRRYIALPGRLQTCH